MNNLVTILVGALLLFAASVKAAASLDEPGAPVRVSLADQMDRHHEQSTATSARRRRRRSVEVPTAKSVAKLEREVKRLRSMFKDMDKPDAFPCLGKGENDKCSFQGFNHTDSDMIMEFHGHCHWRHVIREELTERFQVCSKKEDAAWPPSKEFDTNYLQCLQTCIPKASNPDELRYGGDGKTFRNNCKIMDGNPCNWWCPHRGQMMNGECRYLHGHDNFWRSPDNRAAYCMIPRHAKYERAE